MKVTALTRDVLKLQRVRRSLMAAGFEEVGENGGKLWELYRGGRTRHVITTVQIDPGGKALWIKTAPRERP